MLRMNEEYEALALRLSEEEYAHAETELRWKAAEERCGLIEQEVREQCWEEMEERLEEEKRRWHQAWEEQAVRHDEHLNKKLDLLSREIKGDAAPSAETKVYELTRENNALRKQVAMLQRQIQCHTPTKTPMTPLRPSKENIQPESRRHEENEHTDGDRDIRDAMARVGKLRLDEGPIKTIESNKPQSQPHLNAPMARSSPMKKKHPVIRRQRILTSRQRDLLPESELDDF
ncbi:hypothetical protein KEM55_009093 [Ascosphaera atra]|nr:hypothetical protein KEM55_009093 [Ascosphaera atra]